MAKLAVLKSEAAAAGRALGSGEHLTLAPLGPLRRAQEGFADPAAARILPASVALTDEAFAELLELVAEGWSLGKIAALHGLRVPGALWPAINTNTSRRLAYRAARAAYGEACAARADTTADLVLAGELRPDAAKVVIDQARWAASRADPHTWGEQQRVSIEGDIHVHQASDDDLRDQLAGIVSALAARPVVDVVDVTDAEVVEDSPGNPPS